MRPNAYYLDLEGKLKRMLAPTSNAHPGERSNAQALLEKIHREHADIFTAAHTPKTPRSAPRTYRTSRYAAPVQAPFFWMRAKGGRYSHLVQCWRGGRQRAVCGARPSPAGNNWKRHSYGLKYCPKCEDLRPSK